MDEVSPVERLEFRPDHKGAFDEIVARFADGMVHVETLSDQGCYVGFYWDDGRYCQWWVGCTGRGKLTYNHEDGQDPPLKHPGGYGPAEIERLSARIKVLETAASSCPNCCCDDCDAGRRISRAALLQKQQKEGDGA